MKEYKKKKSKDSSDFANFTGTISSESYRNDEDLNLLNKPDLNNPNSREIFVNGVESFIDKFLFIKSNNLFFRYIITNDASLLLLMYIISLTTLILLLAIKLYFNFFVSNKIFSFLSILIIPFEFCSLIKNILLYRDLTEKKINKDDNDILMLFLQKWNMIYPISIFIFSLNIFFQIFFEDIFPLQNKFSIVIKIIEIIMQFLTLIILSFIYYESKSNKNGNLLYDIINNVFSWVSFPLSFSALLSFVLIVFVDYINLIVIDIKNFCFLIITGVSILVMVYYNDFILPIFVLIYQFCTGNQLFNLEFNFQKICIVTNFCLIIYLFVKMYRDKINVIEDDKYNLLKDEINYSTKESMAEIESNRII